MPDNWMSKNLFNLLQRIGIHFDRYVRHRMMRCFIVESTTAQPKRLDGLNDIAFTIRNWLCVVTIWTVCIEVGKDHAQDLSREMEYIALRHMRLGAVVVDSPQVLPPLNQVSDHGDPGFEIAWAELFWRPVYSGHSTRVFTSTQALTSSGGSVCPFRWCRSDRSILISSSKTTARPA